MALNISHILFKEGAKLSKTTQIRSVEEINEKIRKGDVVVLTAEEMIKLVENSGVKIAAKEVDVVTSGTFGAMCSSATSGHAISFGEADSATVIASNTSLADAVATAVCNAVVGEDIQASIQLGLKMAESIKGVRGALIVRDEHAGLTGRLPKLVRVDEKQFDALQFRKF